MSNRSYSLDFKLEVLKAYESINCSEKDFCRTYGISTDSLKHWLKVMKTKGVEGLRESKAWKRYPKELKLQAVKDYESGRFSMRKVVERYDISSHMVLRDWIAMYNGHKELKETGRSSSLMTKGRSTTLKERIEIVQDCLALNRDYNQTADQHGVSYQQVYQWVRKYESGGWEALKDRRGRSKEPEELTREDKISLEIRRIKKDNERLRAENAYLKKLEQIERRDR